MKKQKFKLLVSLMLATGLASPLAHATNGYFAHGYGMKAKGMAGVGIALPQDSLAAATNPAGMALVGDRVDIGVDWFKPVRNTELTSALGPAAGSYDGNGDSSFFIPEFGYNMSLDANSTFGISIYGNGGMNTKYTDLNARTGGQLFGQGDLGVDFSQLFISPTYAVKVNADNAVGVSLNLAYQRFKAEGLQNFANANYSSDPANVTNNGYDSSTGWGLRIGWTGQVTPTVTLGATYQSKTKMAKFSKYAGLFADQGGFDIPSSFGVGIAVKVTDMTTLAADVQQTMYGEIKSINNTGNVQLPLGFNDGPGFGWRNMTVIKLGLSHQYDNGVVVRAGYSNGRQPIPSTETYFNVIAPGVIQDHVTLGATWPLPSNSELTVAYMHAFEHSVTGAGPTTGFNLKMHQDSLGVAFGWKL